MSLAKKKSDEYGSKLIINGFFDEVIRGSVADKPNPETKASKAKE
jgi:hypothetical protein